MQTVGELLGAAAQHAGAAGWRGRLRRLGAGVLRRVLPVRVGRAVGGRCGLLGAAVAARLRLRRRLREPGPRRPRACAAASTSARRRGRRAHRSGARLRVMSAVATSQNESVASSGPLRSVVSRTTRRPAARGLVAAPGEQGGVPAGELAAQALPELRREGLGVFAASQALAVGEVGRDDAAGRGRQQLAHVAAADRDDVRQACLLDAGARHVHGAGVVVAAGDRLAGRRRREAAQPGRAALARFADELVPGCGVVAEPAGEAEAGWGRRLLLARAAARVAAPGPVVTAPVRRLARPSGLVRGDRRPPRHRRSLAFGAEQAGRHVGRDHGRLDGQRARPAERVQQAAPRRGLLRPRRVQQHRGGQVLLERRLDLHPVGAVAAPVQAVAAQVQRDGHLAVAEVAVDAHVRALRVDGRARPVVPGAELVDDGVLDAHGPVPGVADRVAGAGEVDDQGAVRVQVGVPVHAQGGGVQLVPVGRGARDERQQHASREAGPQAHAIGGLQLALERHAGAGLARVLDAEAAQLAGQERLHAAGYGDEEGVSHPARLPRCLSAAAVSAPLRPSPVHLKAFKAVPRIVERETRCTASRASAARPGPTRGRSCYAHCSSPPPPSLFALPGAYSVATTALATPTQPAPVELQSFPGDASGILSAVAPTTIPGSPPVTTVSGDDDRWHDTAVDAAPHRRRRRRRRRVHHVPGRQRRLGEGDDHQGPGARRTTPTTARSPSRFYSVGADGAVEPEKTVTVKIDTTPAGVQVDRRLPGGHRGQRPGDVQLRRARPRPPRSRSAGRPSTSTGASRRRRRASSARPDHGPSRSCPATRTARPSSPASTG